MNESQDRYKQYIQTRNEYISKQYDQGKEYDKVVFLLASGSFAVTFTFISDVIKNVDNSTIWLIIVSWSLNLTNIIMAMISYQITYYAYKREIVNIDNEYDAGTSALASRNWYATVAEYLNHAHIIIMSLSFIFLMLFVGKNFDISVNEILVNK